jgi:type I restriction enzyme S subunit
MVNMGELFDYKRIPDMSLARVPLDEPELSRSTLRTHDLLFARRSLKWDGAGKCSIILSAEEDRTFESSIIRVRIDPTLADPRFYFYWFTSEVGHRRIGTIVEQVAVAGIRGSDLGRLLVPYPAPEEQRRIASGLWAIDDRIDINWRLIKTIERSLRARYSKLIYEHADTGHIDTIASLVSSVKTKAARRHATLPYIGLEHMPQFHIFLGEWGCALDSKTATRAFLSGDVLFGRIRPYLGKVGLALTSGVCAQSVEVLRPTEDGLREFVLLLLASPEVINYADQVSTGTTMPQAPWDAVEAFEVVVPPRRAIDNFSAVARPLIERASNAVREVRVLTALRERLAFREMTPLSQPHPCPTVEALA